MDAGAFLNDNVVKASKMFIPVHVDWSQDSKLYNKFNKSAVPWAFFLDEKGELIEKLVSTKVDEITKQMNCIAVRFASKQITETLKNANGDVWDMIRKNIKDLGNEDPLVRDKATLELTKLKKVLDDALFAASFSNDPEVRARINTINGDFADPIIVPITANSTLKFGDIHIEFREVGKDQMSFMVTGIESAQVAIQDSQGNTEIMSIVGKKLYKVDLQKNLNDFKELKIFRK